MSVATALLWTASLVLPAAGLSGGAYQQPPPPVREALDARALPLYQLDPSQRTLAIIEPRRWAALEDLARPSLRAGTERIDTGAVGPLRSGHIESLRLRAAFEPKAALREVRLPRGEGSFYGFAWAPDGDRFVLLRRTADATELWAGETRSASVRRIDGLRLRAFIGEPLDWLGPDQLLVTAVPMGRPPPPSLNGATAGPLVAESLGRPAGERTRGEPLRAPQDDAVFDYLAVTQLMLVDLRNGTLRAVGRPGAYAQVEPLADGRWLLAERLQRPLSVQPPWEDAARIVELLDANARPLRELARIPARTGTASVPSGPRQFFASPAADGAVYWVESVDPSGPRASAAAAGPPARDRVLRLLPPYTGEPVEMFRLSQRLARGWLLEDGLTMLVEEVDRERGRVARRLVDLRQPNGTQRLLTERAQRERYADPGQPVLRTLASGRRAVRLDSDHVYFTGTGASVDGDRPFVDRLSLVSGEVTRLFRADPQAHETLVRVLDDEGRRLLTLRESATEPPNLLLRENSAPGVWLTQTPDPAPLLRKVRRELVRYKRADGVDLSFWLTLPPDYKPGERRATVLWAYPLEFTDAVAAGQVRGSPNRFVQPAGLSPVHLALDGYVVLEDAAMPIVGDAETVNNTFIEQIVANATAAIDKATGLGVTDPERVAVGGHSYGAFMAVNLLAHSNLFKAGIAISGAYNRTLTPFGFQGERRTLWEARELYLRISPLLAAERVREPLLLLHGAADQNPGTLPAQSERLYQALAALGGAARLVLLPYEGHVPAARESVGHLQAEQIAWLRRYLGPPLAKPER
jgi:dipeptidyl aminopeptidase/acylaminoacyl peptidase